MTIAKKVAQWNVVGVLTAAMMLLPVCANALDWRVMSEGAFERFFEALEEEKEAPYYSQVKDIGYTFIGRQDLTTTRGGYTRCFADGDAVTTYRPADAWVLDASAGERVLMFNEHHDHVAPRAFVYQLLPALRERGFTHLAAEGFGLDKGEPLGPHSGLYSNEPVFAALIRRAQALGFELVAYEHWPKENDIALREQGQAENLSAAVEAAGVDARFVVYAGGSHITERPIFNGERFVRWMAGRFAELSGIDPFTVNLSDCAYRADSPFVARVALNAEGDVRVGGGSHQGVVDAQIQLPVPSAPRLGFYRQLLGEPTTIELPPVAGDEEVLVRAWLPEDVVPLDQVLVRPGETATLYLPSGTHRVTVNTGDGTVVREATVTVE